MRQSTQRAYFFIVIALFACCLGHLPLNRHQLATKRDPYCDAFDRTARSFGFYVETRAAESGGERSLPFLVGTLGYYPLKWAAKDLFERNKVEGYTELLHDMVVTFKETHKRLINCGHCLDEFIGKIFYKYLPDYSPHPSVTLTDNEFATRAIEFLGELGDDLEKRLQGSPAKDDTSFDAFWDYAFKTLDTVWRDDDFGGLLRAANLISLISLGSEPYVEKAIKSDGRKIYGNWLHCRDVPTTPSATPSPSMATATVATATVTTALVTTTTTAKSDEFCDALDRWVVVFSPSMRLRSRTARSLPWFFSLGGKGAVESFLKDIFDKTKVTEFNGLLEDLVPVLKGTHNQLAKCNHCLDHFIGTVLQEFLVGHAPDPRVTLNEEQFTARLIEFIGQLGDDLQSRLHQWPPSAKLDFEGFFKYVYDSLDKEWQGSDDFGGLLSSIGNAMSLTKIFSKDYVKEAIETQLPKIREDYFKCNRG